MEKLQARYKAVVAFVTTLAGMLLSFYQAHQNLTLKQVVGALIGAVVGAVLVHQVPNQTSYKK